MVWLPLAVLGLGPAGLPRAPGPIIVRDPA